MEIRTFEPRLSPGAATDRTDRITLGSYLRGRIESLLGRGPGHEAIYPVYCPDCIAYTTVELHRVARSSRTEKFLVGIDAVTGRVSEVNIELPPRERRDVDEAAVIRPTLDRSDAESEWNEWIFPYLDCKCRSVKRPEYALDRVELVHIPLLARRQRNARGELRRQRTHEAGRARRDDETRARALRADVRRPDLRNRRLRRAPERIRTSPVRCSGGRTAERFSRLPA